jgi:TP901 family phage tail tape measure protein
MASGTSNIKIFIDGKDAANTIKGLSSEHYKLNREIKELVPGTEAYKKKAAEIANLKGVLNEHKQHISKITDAYAGLKTGIGQVVGLTATVFAANSLVSYGSELLNLQTRVVGYQGALSELSAITGVTGEGLQGLEDRAANLSTITLASGEIITNTSTDIIDAFKLVGSAKPELLKSAEGMEAFTKEALIFAKASKTSVNEAVNSLSTTLEQFQAPASDASRYMNVLAAGAKEGSVEIKETANGIQKFGAVSQAMNVTVEESVALIQTLGKTFKTGEESGTDLRNILTKIAAPENLPKEALAGLEKYGVSLKKLQDPTTSLAEKLKELSKIQADAGVMGKVFGDENIVAGRVILSNISKFNDLTKAVTGTSEAYNQAAIMSDNLGTDVENLKNTAGQFATELANKAAPAMRALTQSLTEGVKWIKANWDAIVGFGKAIIYVTGIAFTYIATFKIIEATQRAGMAIMSAYRLVALAFGKGLEAAAAAQRILNFVMSINPYAAVASAIIVVSAAITGLVTQFNRAYDMHRLVSKGIEEMNQKMVQEKSTIEQTIAPLKDKTASLEAKREAINKLNQAYPEILKKYNLEKGELKDITALENELIASIERRIAVEMRDLQVGDLIREKNQLKLDLNRKLESQANGATMVDEQGNDLVGGQIDLVQNKIDAIENRIKSVNSEWNKTFNLDKSTGSDPNNPKTPPSGAGGQHLEKGKEESEEAKKLQRLRELLIQYNNDVAQLNATRDESEQLKINEKYAKQLAETELLLKSKDPNIRRQAVEIVKQLTALNDKEILAMLNKKHRELEATVKKHEEDVAALEMSAHEVKMTNIRQRYTKELDEAKQLELSQKPEIVEQGTQARIRLEKAMNAELKVEQQKFDLDAATKLAEKLQKEYEDTEKFKADMLKLTADYEQLLSDLKKPIGKTDATDGDSLAARKEEIDDAANLEIAGIEKQVKAELAIIGDDNERKVALEQALQNRIKAIRAKANKEKATAEKTSMQETMKNYAAIAGSIGDAFVALGDIIGNESEKASAIQKVAALAKIAFDTAAAISGVVAAASSTSLTPIDQAIKIASGIAMVLANVAQAKKVINEAPKVQKQFGGFSDEVTGPDDGRKYRVQYVGRPQTGMLPNSPIVYPSASGHNVLASERGREFLVSNPDLANPAIFNHVQAIQNIKKFGQNATIGAQLQTGGFTAPPQYNAENSTNIAQSNPILSMLVQEISRLNTNLESGIQATVPDDTITAIRRRYDKLNKASGNVLETIVRNV